MFGFTLSKLNLLIFVIAVFGILAFFMFHFTESIKSKQLNELVNDYAINISEMVSSPSYCDSLQRYLPSTLRIVQTDLYYVMKISIQESGEEDEFGNSLRYVIFSASERRDPDRIIAASSFKTTAQVFLYTNNKDQCPSGNYCSQDYIVFDPEASVPVNSFWAVKEIQEGEKKLYIVSCTVTSGIVSVCEAAKSQVGEQLVHKETPKGFKC